MSASYLVDLGNTTGPQFAASAGSFFAASGANVSNIVDMLSYNSFTNLAITGIWQYPSGELRVQVQTSDDTVSGNFTDPTSGLTQMPTSFQSGGIIFLNSGGGNTTTAPSDFTGKGGIFGSFVSGQCVYSGFVAAAGFQRPGRYARSIVLSGGFVNLVGGIAFVSQLKTTGSGGGFSLAPGSGSVAV